jgi:predicted nucleic acid-binding protein
LTFVYDAGALIAAERGSRGLAQLHDEALFDGEPDLPIIPAAVLAQVWAGSARQALLSRMLESCVIEEFDERQARAIGRMRVVSGTSDVVDLAVVEIAIRRAFTIVTSDPGDMTRILDALNMGRGTDRPRIHRI